MHRAVVLAVSATLCCGEQAADVAWEDSTFVPAWSLTLVEQVHGPPNSDFLTIDLFVAHERGDRRLLAKSLVGPLIPLPNAKKVFACEGNSIIGTRAAVLLDLDGTSVTLPPHPGFVRNCSAVGTGEEVLLHYNLVDSGTPYNLVRIFDSAGLMLLEKRLDTEGDIQFEASGEVFHLRIPVPQLPG